MVFKPRLLVSDKNGRIFDLPGLEPAGMKGGNFFRIPKSEFTKLPHGSELFMLPERAPVGYDPKIKKFVVLKKGFAVSAFVSPGYTVTYNSPYRELKKTRPLPLFSYAAVTFYKGEFYVAALKIDRELRQDLRYMGMDSVKKGAKKLEKIFPRNRLVKHLGTCALIYGCPAAKNFFLSRYEAPLPTSQACNAKCAGCISYQPRKKCPITQPRIKFTPTPEEIAQIALFHMGNVDDPVVSFGQGCEGEPLLAGIVIEKAIRLIRKRTSKGIINMNTNASKPDVLARLFDAGLDSVRVSLNSVREKYYTRYFKPVSYSFKDVMRSIRIAKEKGGFVSVNYLVMPGFTDRKAEVKALGDFIENYRIDMIQWRNLNYDPLLYFKELKLAACNRELIGVRELVSSLKKTYTKVMMGYFNPSKKRIWRKRT